MNKFVRIKKKKTQQDHVSDDPKRKTIKIKQQKNQIISKPDKRYRPKPFRTRYLYEHKKRITKRRRS